MKSNNKFNNHLLDEHEATCSICSKSMPDLMTFIVYWIPPLWRVVDKDEKGYAYKSRTSYNMMDIRRRRYHICDKCYMKEHNSKILFMLFGLLIAIITPVLYFIEQLSGTAVLIGFDANIQNFFLGLIIGVLVAALNTPIKKVILDSMARKQLKEDLMAGKFQHKIASDQANAIKSWTELVPHNDPTHHHTGRHKEA